MGIRFTSREKRDTYLRSLDQPPTIVESIPKVMGTATENLTIRLSIVKAFTRRGKSGKLENVTSYETSRFKHTTPEETHAHFSQHPPTVEAKDSLRTYAWIGHEDINYKLRHHNNATRSDIPHIDSAMQPTHKDLVTHRVMDRFRSFDNQAGKYVRIPDLQPGDEFTDKGYTSTTIDPNKVAGIAHHLNTGASDANPHGYAHVIIHVPKGHPAVYIPTATKGQMSDNEQELLLHRGTHYKVKEVRPATKHHPHRIIVEASHPDNTEVDHQ